MSQYKVTSYDTTTGKQREDIFPADNEGAARALATAQGLTVVRIKAQGATQREPRSVSVGDRAQLFRLLAELLGAGLTLMESVQIAGQTTSNLKLRNIMSDVARKVEKGLTLAEALSLHPKTFERSTVGTIASGEGAGSLVDTLESLANSMERSYQTQRSVRGAMIYPAIVLSIAIIVGFAMIQFLLPVFIGMYGDLGGELPALTRAIIWVKDSMLYIIGGTIALAVGAFFYWKANREKEEFRLKADMFKLSAPIMGSIIHYSAVARTCENWSVLLRAGVPVLQSFESVRGVTGNIHFEHHLTNVETAVKAGNDLSQRLAGKELIRGKKDLIPVDVVRLVEAGEAAGEVEQMLMRASHMYYGRVEDQVTKLKSAIEPLSTVVIGLIVGTLVVAMYLPILGAPGLIE